MEILLENVPNKISKEEKEKTISLWAEAVYINNDNKKIDAIDMNEIFTKKDTKERFK